jgi:hypothetical protein
MRCAELVEVKKYGVYRMTTKKNKNLHMKLGLH